MKSRHILTASVLAIALAACGNSPAPEAPAADAAPVEPAATTEPAPVEAAPAPAEAAPAATTGSKPAVVADCATTIEGNDAMQYNADSITIPASCSQFTVNLKHVGKLAVNVMGHNFVVAKEADMAGINADGMAVAPEHVKPDDARVIAHTRMIGGGESASVTFDVARIKDTSPLKFFCSFPGHLSLMQGSLAVQ